MAKKISFINFKGGVGKTTSCLSIAGELAQRGFKTLIIDLDPQGNSSSALGRKGETKEDDKTSKLLLGEIEDVVVKTDIENLFIVPTCLFNLGRTMKIIDSDTVHRADIRLKKSLKLIENEFDYIMIDCSPSDNVLNTNALVSSDYVIIPVKLDKYSLEGFDLLQEKIEVIKEESNDNLEILGIIPTMYKNTSLYKMLIEVIEGSGLNEYMFKTKIRSNVKLEESPFQDTTINFYDKKSNGAKDYKALTDELLEKLK